MSAEPSISSTNSLTNEASGSRQLDLITWNVWFDDASGEQRYPAILDDLLEQDSELVFLQEITPRFLELFADHAASQRYQLHASRDAQRHYGQVFLSKRPLLLSREYALESKYGRDALFGLYPLNARQALILVNVHLESGIFESDTRQVQIKAIQSELLPKFKAEARQVFPELEVVQVLWAGDFNLRYAEFRAGIAGFTDAGKYFNNNAPTYHIDHNQLANYTASLFEDSARLDRVFIMQFGASAVKSYQVRNSAAYADLSDHYSLAVTIEW